MSQSEEGIKNNLEVLAWKTLWEVVPYIKILKNGRKYDLGRETKCSLLDINRYCSGIASNAKKYILGVVVQKFVS